MNQTDETARDAAGPAQTRRRGWRLHWQGLRRSLGRRWREWRLPGDCIRLDPNPVSLYTCPRCTLG